VDALLEETRRRGMAIRDARTFSGLDSHVRVSVRRPEDNDRLLAAFRSVADDA
jgi:threonine-phosphate decarboxylase